MGTEDVPGLPKDFFDSISGIEELTNCLRGQPRHCTWVEKEWLCCRCKVLLVRAWTSDACGHSFCSDCLQEIVYFRDICPRDKNEIRKSQFIRRKDIEHEVYKTFVRCPFGCRSNYPVMKLLQHKLECKGNALTSNYSPVVESKSCDQSCKFKIKRGLYETQLQELNDIIKRQDDKLAEQSTVIEDLKCKMERLQRSANEEIDTVSKQRDCLTDTINQLKQKIMFLEERQSKLSDSALSICDVTCVTPNFETQFNDNTWQNNVSDSASSRVSGSISASASISASISGSAHADRSASASGSGSTSGSASASASGNAIDEIGHEEQKAHDLTSHINFPVIKTVSVTINNLRELVHLSRMGTEIPYESEKYCVDPRGHLLQIVVHLNGFQKAKGKFVSVLIRAVENNLAQNETLWPLQKHVKIMLSSPNIKKKGICFDKTFEFHKPPSPESSVYSMKFFEKKLLDEIIGDQNHLSFIVNFTDECDMNADNRKLKKFNKR